MLRKGTTTLAERQLAARRLPNIGCRTRLILPENGKISLPANRPVSAQSLVRRTTKWGQSRAAPTLAMIAIPRQHSEPCHRRIQKECSLAESVWLFFCVRQHGHTGETATCAACPTPAVANIGFGAGLRDFSAIRGAICVQFLLTAPTKNWDRKATAVRRSDAMALHNRRKLHFYLFFISIY